MSGPSPSPPSKLSTAPRSNSGAKLVRTQTLNGSTPVVATANGVSDPQAGVPDAVAEPGPPPSAYPEAAAQFDAVIRAVEGDSIIGWAQDRIDPDAMAAAGLCYLILKKHYGKKFTCYTSRRMTFPMNRNLAKNFLPAGLLRRCEQEENLKDTALAAPLTIIVDATSVEVMTDFNKLLQRSGEFRAKNFFFVDHHRRAAEGDVEGLKNAQGIRLEGAQSATAIFVHLLLGLGLELDPSDEEEFKLAVAAKAGIEIDTIGQPVEDLTEAARSALAYLDQVVGEEGRLLVEKLRTLKYPISWYTMLGNAMRVSEQYDRNCAVCGLGVIDDNGILPFVANALMETRLFQSVIVFGIVFDEIEGSMISVDLEASGRSQANTEIALPDLFGEVFYWIDDDGRRISRGGGRTNAVLGDHSSTGASVPLPYWRHLPSRSLEEKIEILRQLGWASEFHRIQTLLAPRLEMKPEFILSVDKTSSTV